jgi:hypothetical protein
MRDDLKDRISLYLYNELEDGEREALETELESDPELARAVESERRFLQTLNQRTDRDAPHALLVECRHDLMRAVYRLGTQPETNFDFSGWLARIPASLRSLRLAWQPTAALALLVVGFFAGRNTERIPLLSAPARNASPVTEASLIGSGSGSLRDVQSVQVNPENGTIEIVVEEVTRRTIRGSSQDPHIRGLLITTVQDYPNSGVRLESLDALTPRAADQEVQRALLATMIEDDNPGVRLKALEALKPLHNEPEVRQGLVRILQEDDNPGMRVQAIELLTEKPDRELVSVLQNLVSQESNNYVRLRMMKTLHDLNASVDRF